MFLRDQHIGFAALLLGVAIALVLGLFSELSARNHTTPTSLFSLFSRGIDFVDPPRTLDQSPNPVGTTHEPLTVLEALEAETQQSLKHQWLIIVFGFTHCPDVCPNTLAQLAKFSVKSQWKNTSVVFVSVDPTNDTPERLKNYLANFDPDFIGIAPSQHLLEQLSSGLGMLYSSTPGNIGHSSTMAVIGPDQRLYARLWPGFDQDSAHALWRCLSSTNLPAECKKAMRASAPNTNWNT